MKNDVLKRHRRFMHKGLKLVLSEPFFTAPPKFRSPFAHRDVKKLSASSSSIQFRSLPAGNEIILSYFTAKPGQKSFSRRKLFRLRNELPPRPLVAPAE